MTGKIAICLAVFAAGTVFMGCNESPVSSDGGISPSAARENTEVFTGEWDVETGGDGAQTVVHIFNSDGTYTRESDGSRKYTYEIVNDSIMVLESVGETEYRISDEGRKISVYPIRYCDRNPAVRVRDSSRCDFVMRKREHHKTDWGKHQFVGVWRGGGWTSGSGFVYEDYYLFNSDGTYLIYSYHKETFDSRYSIFTAYSPDSLIVEMLMDGRLGKGNDYYRVSDPNQTLSLGYVLQCQIPPCPVDYFRYNYQLSSDRKTLLLSRYIEGHNEWERKTLRKLL
ncbi:MAG: hypothetical protein LBI42_08220 [Chitinispirillales bacterium]|jgi:hypothetical protein|nr:hypothetical protein [Chitinispirillales bacterium]